MKHITYFLPVYLYRILNLPLAFLAGIFAGALAPDFSGFLVNSVLRAWYWLI